jgi:hypothetical protein
MSISYQVVNPQKRQCFDIGVFGESEAYPLRISCSDGTIVHSLALAYLLSGPFGFQKPLFGAWAGDSVFYPSDHDDPDQNGFSFGIHTATPEEPERTLYGFATEECEDISIPLVAALCDWDYEILKVLVSRAASGAQGSYCRRAMGLILTDGTYRSVYFEFRRVFADNALRLLYDITRFSSEEMREHINKIEQAAP